VILYIDRYSKLSTSLGSVEHPVVVPFEQHRMLLSRGRIRWGRLGQGRLRWGRWIVSLPTLLRSLSTSIHTPIARASRWAPKTSIWGRLSRAVVGIAAVWDRLRLARVSFAPVWGWHRRAKAGIYRRRLQCRSIGGRLWCSPRRATSWSLLCGRTIRWTSTPSPVTSVHAVGNASTIIGVWIGRSVWCWLVFFGEADHTAGKGSVQILTIVDPNWATNDAPFVSNQVLQKSAFIERIRVECAIWTRVDVGQSASLRILEGVSSALIVNFFQRVEFAAFHIASSKAVDPESQISWRWSIRDMDSDSGLAALFLRKEDLNILVHVANSVSSRFNQWFVLDHIWRVLLVVRVPSYLGLIWIIVVVLSIVAVGTALASRSCCERNQG